jgi:hypothetical protein
MFAYSVSVNDRLSRRAPAANGTSAASDYQVTFDDAMLSIEYAKGNKYGKACRPQGCLNDTWKTTNRGKYSPLSKSSDSMDGESDSARSEDWYTLTTPSLLRCRRITGTLMAFLTTFAMIESAVICRESALSEMAMKIGQPRLGQLTRMEPE